MLPENLSVTLSETANPLLPRDTGSHKIHITPRLELPGDIGFGKAIHDKDPAFSHRGTGVTATRWDRPK